MSFLLLGLYPFLLYSKSIQTSHVQAELLSEVSQAAPGQTFRIGISFKILEGWHLYWLNPGDSGEPVKVRWQNSPSSLEVSNLEFPVPSRIELPPLVNYGYSKELLLRAQVSVPQNLEKIESIRLYGKGSWLVCKEECIPEKGEWELEIPLGGTSVFNPSVQARFDQAKPLFAESFSSARGKAHLEGNTLLLTFEERAFPWMQESEEFDFFPLESGIIENGVLPKIERKDKTVQARFQKSNVLTHLPAQLHWIVQSKSKAYQIATTSNAKPEGEHFPLEMILFAFLGGLILNLMPCVFPVLSLKVLSFVRQSNHHASQIRSHGLIYSFGTLLSFWVLTAILFLLKSTGAKLGWGFQLQSPLFIIFLIDLLFLMGLNLLGVFGIGYSLMSKGSRLAERSGYLGSFFTGALATVMATPCVAPFMGPAVAFALTQSLGVAWLIFSALALGMAFPPLLLSFFPKLVRKLPKPGAWMETFKQAMAFLLFGTLLWLLWVLSFQISSQSLILVLCGLLLASLGIWLQTLGNSASSRPFWKTVRKVCGLVLIAWGITTGIAGIQPLNSSLPTSSQHDLWIPYTPEKFKEVRDQGKPLFVDFTAAWCLTCQVNKKVALEKKEVLDRFQAKQVVLMKADWTNQDEKILEALKSYGREGVPLYILYGKGVESSYQILPQLLTPQIVLDALEKI